MHADDAVIIRSALPRCTFYLFFLPTRVVVFLSARARHASRAHITALCVKITCFCRLCVVNRRSVAIT